MKEFFKKITSRKFIACIIGVALGAGMAFGLDENVISSVAGAVTSILSVIVYIYTEGKIDAEAVGKIQDAVSDTKDAIDVVIESEDNCEVEVEKIEE